MNIASYETIALLEKKFYDFFLSLIVFIFAIEDRRNRYWKVLVLKSYGVFCLTCGRSASEHKKPLSTS